MLTTELKNKILAALIDKRNLFSGSDAAFAKQLGISPAVFSRVKSGVTDKIVAENQWIRWGRELGVAVRENSWRMARTEVFTVIEEDVTFCKNNSKAMICIDDVGIGKSYAARYLAQTLPNTFYIDSKQAKSKQLFIRLIAKTVGIDSTGKFSDVKDDLKFYLPTLPNPMIIIDDSGYLDYTAYLELLELWDATEGACGWYQIGDDSLRKKIEKGINSRKVGYKALFSRYSKRFSSISPVGLEDKKVFYKKLITDVLSVNMTDKTELNKLVLSCLNTDLAGNFGDLRRAESLLKIYA